jgi:hypothetical protein
MRDPCQPLRRSHDAQETELPADHASSAEVHSGSIARRAALLRALTVSVAALAAVVLTAMPGYGAGTRTVDIELKNGKVVGKNSVRVPKGDTVLLRWSSDKRIELHLHGYDVTTAVNPGTPAEMKILARATGRFPVEIHGQGSSSGGHGHKTLFHLEVYPD